MPYRLRQISFCFGSATRRFAPDIVFCFVIVFCCFEDFVSFRSGGDLANSDYSTEGVTNPKFAIAKIDAPALTLSKAPSKVSSKFRQCAPLSSIIVGNFVDFQTVPSTIVANFIELQPLSSIIIGNFIEFQPHLTLMHHDASP